MTSVPDPRAHVRLGLGLLRATATLPLRLLGLGRTPLALAAAPVRTQRVLERPPLAVRSRGADLDVARTDLAVAFPHATGRVAVFVSSPGSDESSWDGRYGERLARISAWTPVYVRADDSVPLSTASLELSALLQQLVSGWPVKVQRIALIGHGGGALIARGACGIHEVGRRRPWTDRVSDLIALGAPHLAVPPQRGGTRLARRLGEDLAGLIEVGDSVVAVPPLEKVRYYLVTDRATHTTNPLGRTIGNLLWWRQRATLRHRDARELFPTAQSYAVSTRHHSFADHPDIEHALLDWLV